jgi:hypothetical protein
VVGLAEAIDDTHHIDLYIQNDPNLQARQAVLTQMPPAEQTRVLMILEVHLNKLGSLSVTPTSSPSDSLATFVLVSVPIAAIVLVLMIAGKFCLSANKPRPS